MKFDYSKCLNIDDKIIYICNNEYEYFLNKENVVGVALGYKIKNGFYSYKKCIKVFVRKKVSKNKLLFTELVPAIYKGVDTDVVESGIFKPSSLYNRIRPLIGGYAIGASTSNSIGTLGCLVRDSKSLYLLGNNHTLVGVNKFQLGTSIIQPGIPYGGIVSKDTVGNLSKYIYLKLISSKEKPENYVDCAIAKVAGEYMVSPKIALIGNLKGIDNAKLNDHVAKVGATTELTTGIVTEIGATMIVPYTRGTALFKNQVVTTRMSDSGDSGSILMNINKYAIGLLCGNTLTNTLYNPMELVLSSLNVKLVTE